MQHTCKKSNKTAIRQGYQDTPTQILPKEDVALVIKGNKITDDISQPLRFHASRETAQKHSMTKNRKPWTKECFDKIDWHNLDLPQKNKADMFKIWRSKQISGFCGSRVQMCVCFFSLQLRKVVCQYSELSQLWLVLPMTLQARTLGAFGSTNPGF